ncbi:MAG: hypothetical protein K2X01_00990 [Cyanobacteria bacterium]|nr:hypothetical protein [Cyanobacteriota bacterium]
MQTELKIYRFGTSGYRSDQEDGFNDTVVKQITQSIIDYLIESHSLEVLQSCPVLIGGDTREKSRRYIPLIARWLNEAGLDVFQADGDLPTPVLAYAAKFFEQLGLGPTQTVGAVLMTASHNPWAYGGYNFLTPDAAVVPSSISARFAELQASPKHLSLQRKISSGEITPQTRVFDPFTAYQQHLKTEIGINYARIKESGLTIAYDPLYATGRKYFPNLLQAEGIKVQGIHLEDTRPHNYQGMPEPSASNLSELAALVKAVSKEHPLTVGFANDGDADRFGVLDEAGRFVSPNDVLLLTLYHLLTHRKHHYPAGGVLVRSQASSHILDALCRQHGIEVIQTPVGYKYIAETFIEREEEGLSPVILGGESSGGLSIGGHIPEKDGLIANLLIAELIATENKALSQILSGIKADLSEKFAFQELSIHTEKGKAILEAAKTLDEFSITPQDRLSFDAASSQRTAESLEQHYGTRDGVKLYAQDDSWFLFRMSGTEPLARIYFEVTAATAEAAEARRAATESAVRQWLESEYGIPSDSIKAKD